MYLLRAALLLTGIVVVWLGLNISLGGIQTLGWQGSTKFLSITDPVAFAVQDNHIRFIAGVWTGLGVFLMLGARKPHQLASVLKALCAMVFLGGLARLTAAEPALIFGPGIGPSLAAELIGFPLLGLWVHTSTRGFKDA